MEENKRRNLDVTTASMDKLALNNLVVSFRKVAKEAKLKTILRLTKKIKSLRNVKGEEKLVAKSSRRADGLLEEVMACKKIVADDIIKMALRNEKKFDDFAKEGGHSAVDKAKMRVSSQKLLTDKVQAWRSQHADWKELAAFLNTNITRRYKKKKKKDKTNKKSNVKNKGKADSQKSDNKGQARDETKTESPESEKEPEVKKKNKTQSQKSKNNVKAKNENEAESLSKKRKNSDSEENDIEKKDLPRKKLKSKTDATDKKNKNKSKLSGVASPKIATQSTDSDKSSDAGSLSDHDSELLDSSVLPSISKTKTKSESKKPLPVSFQSGAKVVKQLNLDEIDDGMDNILIENKVDSDEEEMIPSILMEDGKRMRTSGDSFFIGNDYSSSDSEIDIVEIAKDAQSSSDESFVSDNEGQQPSPRGSKRVMDSMFLGSLSQRPTRGKPKPFHKNTSTFQPNRSTDKKPYKKQDQTKPQSFKDTHKKDWNKNKGSHFQRREKFDRNHSRGGKFPRSDRNDNKREGQHKSGGHHQGAAAGRGKHGSFQGGRDKGPAVSRGPPHGKGPAKVSVPASSEVLHPSWQASKKRKEETCALTAFKGKKITFDD